jgi:2-C-methyl-D-erythritol 4-phosphate cytidylyltransferase
MGDVLRGVAALHCGGATRAETVANALAALAARSDDDDWILVHDAARPCIPADALQRLATELADDAVGGLLAVPVADTLKREDRATPARVLRTEDRAGLWQAQTPQMFRYGVLRAALALPGALRATDEAAAVESLAATGACAPPWLIMGSALNIKITYATDLALAAAILALQEQS